MSRYVCIHGHFYQPPRENPWLEEIEVQDSAFPYHDWNEKIAAECYATNGYSRILDAKGRVTEITNNYSKISFNFGPTLLQWLENKRPDIYQAILQADKISQQNFSGHGNAIAQVYNHMIMPLAHGRDRYTQIFWGLRDFERRFGRKAEGMWLAETAVDEESLRLMSELGIVYTILAPHQAKAIRKIGDTGEWKSVEGARIDPRVPYRVNVGWDRSITVFFYDGPIAQSVAFGGTLHNGERFAKKLLSAFTDSGNPELVHIATDGETYGHHHRFGDMALAYAIYTIEQQGLAKLTNYGQFLELYPPTYEAQIINNTSWSCVHGVDRWKAHCGCSLGTKRGYKQYWREHLRNAFDWLRDRLAERFDHYGRRYFNDPWHVRNHFIEVISDRSGENVERFFKEYGVRSLSADETTTALKLLEMQRHAMLMYTSCGWFFDELSGIETVQCMQYAGRAIQLAQEVFGEDFEGPFLHQLSLAKSNVPELQDGRKIYELLVKPAMVDLLKVGAHFAISSLFKSYPEESRIFCYSVKTDRHEIFHAGKAKLVLGTAELASKITRDSRKVIFAVVHFGGHNVNAGIRYYQGEDTFQGTVDKAGEVFLRADYGELFRTLDKEFGGTTYSLKSLFRDEQRWVLQEVLKSVLETVEGSFIDLYQEHTPAMRFLAETGIPLPKVYKAIADFVRNLDIKRALERKVPDIKRIEAILSEIRSHDLTLDEVDISYAFEKTIERLLEQFYSEIENVKLMETITKTLSLVSAFKLKINSWKAQNIFFVMLKTVYDLKRRESEQGNELARDWVKAFHALGQELSVFVP